MVNQCIEVVHGRLRPNIHTLWTVVVRARDREHAYREKKHQFWSLADYFGFYVEELAHLQQEIFHKEMDCPLGEPTSRSLGVLNCKVRLVPTEERSRPHHMPSDFEASKRVIEVPVHFPHPRALHYSTTLPYLPLLCQGLVPFWYWWVLSDDRL